MRRLARFVVSVLIAILAMIVAESVTSEDAASQQRKPALHVAHDANNQWNWPTAPILHPTEYSQPFPYSHWWVEIATCEGLPVPDSAAESTVQFFSVPSSFFTMDHGLEGMLAGTFDTEPAIYMGAPYVWEEGIVKHEMLHVLLHWSGYEFKNFHPAEIFERPDCGIHILAAVHS